MTRRRQAIAAPVLLLLALGGAAAVGPALRNLAAVRARGALLAQLGQAPPPARAALMAPGAALPAAAAPVAAAALAATLRALALRERLLVEALAPAPGAAPALVAQRLAISGETRRVLRFAEAVENRTPAIRFTRWRLERRGDALRLEAEATMAWEPAR